MTLWLRPKKLEGTDQLETCAEHFSTIVWCEKRSDRTQNLNMSKNLKEKEACTNRVTSKPSKLKKGHTIVYIQFLFIFPGAKILESFTHEPQMCRKSPGAGIKPGSATWQSVV